MPLCHLPQCLQVCLSGRLGAHDLITRPKTAFPTANSPSPPGYFPGNTPLASAFPSLGSSLLGCMPGCIFLACYGNQTCHPTLPSELSNLGGITLTKSITYASCVSLSIYLPTQITRKKLPSARFTQTYWTHSPHPTRPPWWDEMPYGVAEFFFFLVRSFFFFFLPLHYRWPNRLGWTMDMVQVEIKQIFARSFSIDLCE